MTENLRGAVLMVLSMAAFTFNDAFFKLAGETLPLFQAMFLRGIVTTIFLCGLCYHLRAIRWNFSRADWQLLILRTLSEVGAAYFFLTALLNMPLANAAAILQMLPLTVTLGGALFFGEPVGWRRYLAIATGLFGMVLIVNPTAEGFNSYTLYAVISVVFVTARDLATRRMSKDVPSMFVTAMVSVAILVFAMFGAMTVEWVPMTVQLWSYLLGAAAFVSAGYLLSVLVMRVGDVSFVAPFRFSGLLWALVLGLFLFSQWPSPRVLLGAVIVVGSGLFLLLRERQIKSSSKPASRPAP